jgi:D-glycero-D-manno-heptose 1,7-bisphosphate phosphatase
MNKCVFLDRDGVINQDHVNYTYRLEDFKILEGVIEALQLLKDEGYLLVIITNQSGIAKSIYAHEAVLGCYEYLQTECGNLIDGHYYAPYHPDYDSASLTRKPDSLMLEKAKAKFEIDIAQSWLVGDSERDLVAAKKLDLRTIYLPWLSAQYKNGNETKAVHADFVAKNLLEAVREIILKKAHG